MSALRTEWGTKAKTMAYGDMDALLSRIIPEPGTRASQDDMDAAKDLIEINLKQIMLERPATRTQYCEAPVVLGHLRQLYANIEAVWRAEAPNNQNILGLALNMLSNTVESNQPLRQKIGGESTFTSLPQAQDLA